MAYLWSDKITDYYYSNPELDTVAVLWTDPEDNLVREHYIKIDESDEQWKDFVKEVPYEKIDERTRAKHEVHREEFRKAFNIYASGGNIALIDPISVYTFMLDYDENDPKQLENLFKLKLAIFNTTKVKEIVDFELKTSIRKANTPKDALSIFYDMD
jgi:hypothetical protein